MWYHFSGNAECFAFITEIIWQTFDNQQSIIDVAERLLYCYRLITAQNCAQNSVPKTVQSCDDLHGWVGDCPNYVRKTFQKDFLGLIEEVMDSISH